MYKNLSFDTITWGDDVTSRDNYIMMSKQPPSWIRHLHLYAFGFVPFAELMFRVFCFTTSFV